MSNDNQGLSQSDFRRMLQTPRAPAGGASQGGVPRTRGVLGKRRPPTRPQAPAPSRPPKRTTHSADDSSNSAKYRDRAAERRRGAVGGAPEAAPADREAPPGSIGMSTEHRAQYERSKYLGGSVERTHLVKGLDYLLLDKTRSQSATGDGDPGALDLELERLQAERSDVRLEAAAPEDPPRTALGRCVAEALQRAQSGIARLAELMADPAAHVECKGDLFRLGRMYFELAPAALLGTTAPVTRIRGQDHGQAVAPDGCAQDENDDSLVIAKVVAAIARRRDAAANDASAADETAAGSSSGPGSTETRHNAAGASTIAARPGSIDAHNADNDDDDSGDDIFADAGVDYSVTVTARQEEGAATTALPGGGDGSEDVTAPYPDSQDDDDDDDGAVIAPYPDSQSEDD